MTPSHPPAKPHRFAWLSDQPYLLLSLTPAFWAGNAIVGRAAAGHFPPVTLSFLRWAVAFLIVLPFAWPHLKRDWHEIRRSLGLMIAISVIGISAFNTLQYTALEYTTALNILLLQSTGPLFVAIWSLIVLGVRLTLAQALGVLVSMLGVVVILLHGDLRQLADIDLNRGDLFFIIAMALFGLYSALSQRRPTIHGMSFLAFTFGCGALFLVPLLVWELALRPAPQLTLGNLASLGYVAVFPSILAYLCYNRGIELIGANRAAPFFHLIPVFGSAMAIGFLGERPQLYHGFGYALVLAGVYVAARKPKAAG
ncbi:drug/metabolite transporter (DMT)-like permease [Rhodopseudomonas rhenobacensis]|uniref:Drug/metabolite transporter (DMT)-like permease n=1 Tax=Rhodopseudomonas rhenobacensis TaxID=87461 RepID=A0A7W8DYB9_9BRAD|nr:DMT family transporter [Rhodopseudomonas rhenobacensis]MBB5047104.1 drug/metabolite transporter (DMT)-like permease [Rhodopseudomonas rhenobacensis]